MTDVALPVIATITGHCFFKASWQSRGPLLQPPYEAIALLLADLDHMLAVRRLQPVALTCEAWPVPDRPDGMNVLAMITIGAVPGASGRSLRAWYQWQHPRWEWARRPLPVIEHDAGVELLGGA